MKNTTTFEEFVKKATAPLDDFNFEFDFGDVDLSVLNVSGGRVTRVELDGVLVEDDPNYVVVDINALEGLFNDQAPEVVIDSLLKEAVQQVLDTTIIMRSSTVSHIPSGSGPPIVQLVSGIANEILQKFRELQNA